MRTQAEIEALIAEFEASIRAAVKRGCGCWSCVTHAAMKETGLLVARWAAGEDNEVSNVLAARTAHERN